MLLVICVHFNMSPPRHVKDGLKRKENKLYNPVEVDHYLMRKTFIDRYRKYIHIRFNRQVYSRILKNVSFFSFLSSKMIYM